MHALMDISMETTMTHGMTFRPRLAAGIILALCMAGMSTSVAAETLLDLKLVSEQRSYSPKRPKGLTKEGAFSIPGPGLIRVTYCESNYLGLQIDPGYRTARVPGGTTEFAWPGRSVESSTDPSKPTLGKKFCRIGVSRVTEPVRNIGVTLVPLFKSAGPIPEGTQYGGELTITVEYKPGDGKSWSDAGSASAPPSKGKPGQLAKLYDNWNPVACQTTGTSKFRLSNATDMDRLVFWSDTKIAVRGFSGTLTGPGVSIHVNARRGSCQWNWCEEIVELNRPLPAGSYVFKADVNSICQNSGSGGNGFVHVFGRS